MQPLTNQELFDALSPLGVIDAASLEAALAQATKEDKSLYWVLIEKDLVSDENIGKLIADFLSIPFIELSKTQIDLTLLNIIPEIVARKNTMICFGKDSEGIKVAVANPKNREPITFLEKKTGDRVIVYYATPKDIESAYYYYKKDLQKSFNELLEKQINLKDTDDKPVAKFVDLLIEYAYANKASDIHIEPLQSISKVRFRIDGILHDVMQFPKNIHDQMISRIKVLSKLRTDEHLSAQDGKLQITLKQEELDVRVSTVPIVEGEKAVLRLLSSRSRQFGLQDLGMGESDLNKIRNAYNKSYGMVLVTGPTGCGKTTTIYSILKILNTREKNISTIEDPVEYEIEGVNQIQVNPKTNLTFAHGLRSILRQDPNIILVGEIRDGETAGIAINAATTGHLVLSTLHTNDAPTALPRLIDMKVEPFLVASTVNIIVAQRLVRKICEKCRQSQVVSKTQLADQFSLPLINKYFSDSTEVRIYQGIGCPVCYKTGYVGRIGIFEVLEVTPAIRELITKGSDSGTIRAMATQEGMTTMIEDGLLKVASGITTLEEILSSAKE
jgi:type IV pilus assembly protein PilB